MSLNWSEYLGIDPDEVEAGAIIDLPDSFFEQEEELDRMAKGEATGQELNEYEQRFLRYWRMYGDKKFEITPQYIFHPKREWRCDFCFIKQRVIVEVDGMTGGWHDKHTGRWINHESAHRSFEGYSNDRWRDLQAMALGYYPVRIPTTWLHQKPGVHNIKGAIKLINMILRYRQA